MDLRVQGMSPDPFLGAADLFERPSGPSTTPST